MGCASSKQACRDRHSMPVHPLGSSRRFSSGRHVSKLTSSARNRPDDDEAEIMMKRSNDVADKGKTPPETINTWELMAGLEDSIAADFDPDKILGFRDAIEQIPDTSAAPTTLNPSTTGLVKSRVSAFEAEIDERRKRKKCLPNGEKKVVCYFTSMRAVRKTFDDCADVKIILRGYGVKVDERDFWLHKGFREELGEILGDTSGQLPRVFANGKYLGGAEEVRGMHEDGALGKAVEECEEEEETVGTCEGCGDMRFVPCDTCSGSHKVFVGAEADGAKNGFVECSGCNENGLVQCTFC